MSTTTIDTPPAETHCPSGVVARLNGHFVEPGVLWTFEDHRPEDFHPAWNNRGGHWLVNRAWKVDFLWNGRAE